MVSMKRDSQSVPDYDFDIKRNKCDNEPAVAEINRLFNNKEESVMAEIHTTQPTDGQNIDVNPRPILARSSENVSDFALTRLRCLGIEMDGVGAVIEEKGTSRKVHSLGHGEKELRRERGEMLVKLFKEHPSLAGSATARKAEKNLERAQLWEQITRQVNDAFGSRLEMLSVDKVKKLLTYYKKKDDGSYDNIKISSNVALDEVALEGELDCSSSPSRCDSAMSEHGGFENENARSIAVVNSDTDQQLQNFIASLCSTPYDLSAIKPDEAESPSSPVFCETTYQLKKERHDFVVSLAEHYMERMCFDSSSRSAQVNAERHSMWVKVANLTNEKYVGLLSPLGVEQTKKLFSNCKRRRRLRQEKSESDSPLASLPATSVSVSPDGNTVEAITSTDTTSSLDAFLTSNETSPRQNLQGLVHDLDLTVEIKELRRQLAERDAEVARLQRTIVEQANDYKTRINSIVDILKTAADRKVSEDIRVYFSVP